jgi:predicted transposase YdaD
MKTDTQIDTLLGADPDALDRLTDDIEVHGPYLFKALDVKGLARRTDGVLMPQREEDGIWVIEFQAQPDPLEEMLKMLGELTPLEATRAYKELVAKGEAVGRQQGRQEGRQREERLILRLLHRRIGPIP